VYALFSPLNQQKQQRPPTTIFSGEIARPGAVAGGGTTASEPKTHRFQKKNLHINTSFLILYSNPNSKFHKHIHSMLDLTVKTQKERNISYLSIRTGLSLVHQQLHVSDLVRSAPSFFFTNPT
jgi:hypothetical protein